MPKRKRGNKDQIIDEERHSKVRVQELNNAVPARPDSPIESTRSATAHQTTRVRPEPHDAEDKAARRKSKKERRDLRETKNVDNAGANVVQAQQNRDPGEIVEGIRGKEKQKSKKKSVSGKIGHDNIGRKLAVEDTSGDKKGSTHTPQPRWSDSGTVGGQMINLDPIFSQDEQQLLVAYGTFVAVYSISTSLLIRRLLVQKSSTITGLSLDPSDNDYLFVATLSGEISRWNWKEGQKLNVWQISSQIYAMTAARQGPVAESKDLMYTIDKKSGGLWLLSAHRLAADKENTKTEVKTLLKFEDQLTCFMVLNGGKAIVASSGQRLIMGTSDLPAPDKLSEVKYVWRIVDCPEWIVSLDVRCRASERTSKKHVSKGGMLEAIDVVIGGLKGTIHLYEDLLQKLLRKETSGKKGNLENIASSNLHWHRNAVHTVKWSLDGNYVISGGQETVLVLWQLETGQKQNLPHLGAPIESIVVSPAGSSYSIRLNDNSAMILSTAELRPTFSIAGIQIPAISKTQSALPFLPTVDAPHEISAQRRRARYPACVAFHGSDRLLLAVPPSSMLSSKSTMSQNASYLQTCDVSSGHQLSRQALTRTKITTLNMGPESNTIEEPDITHMQVSHDGRWLATIDEWRPPKRDIAQLNYDDEASRQGQIARQEIYLKFWSWSDSDKIWQLVSRVDHPHASDSGDLHRSRRVMSLASNPSTAEFSSVDEEGMVKIWVPTARMRGDLEVKGTDGKALTTWRCQDTTPTATSRVLAETVRMAYAPDGSLLAVASLTTSSLSCIYLIDTSTGVVRGIHAGLSSGPIFGLGIMSKYLVILSHTLQTWDLVNNKVHYEVDLQLQQQPPKLQNASLLAMDHCHNTFALSLPSTSKRGKTRTKVVVMEPTHTQPLFTTTVPSTITNLLPAVGKKAFYTIDADAQIRTFTAPQATLTGLPTPPREATAPPIKGLDELFMGSGPAGETINSITKANGSSHSKLSKLSNLSKDNQRLTNSEPQEEDGKHDTVVVSQEQLAQILDYKGSALSMPPVTELFQQVARLCGGKN